MDQRQVSIESNSNMDAKELIEIVLSELFDMGWSSENGKLIPPKINNKDQLRSFHYSHRLERANKERELVKRHGPKLINEFAEGSEIDPNKFSPELIEVKAKTWDAFLFRFASLLWSVPISRGYGRRMRFIVKDQSNGKLVGLIAIGDPVFNLKARDEDIGWDQAHRKERLYNVMDAFGLGAVPPYNRLLGGKFIALAAVSNEIRDEFIKKYKGQTTIIQGKEKDPSLVLITTTSALGRSSIYNRIKLPGEDESVYRSVGFSSGFGHFQFSDNTFKLLRNYLRNIGDSYTDGYKYGNGPSWRLRTIRKALKMLGFRDNLLFHGVKREVFLMPLATNYREYLLGKEKDILYFDRSLDYLSKYFKNRWMIPRSRRIIDWYKWRKMDTWRIISSTISNHKKPDNEQVVDNELQLPLF